MKKLYLLLSSLTIAVILVGCNSKSDYKSNVQNVADEILENSVKVEEILDEYSNVWKYSIESRGAIPVSEMALQTGLDEDTIKEYFTINSIGNIPDDFSLNVFSMKSYFEESGELRKIEDKAKEIKDKISELNNPPKGYEKVYDELLDMYTFSEEYLEMALNPSGSLQSFNEDKNRLSSDILSQHKRVEATMPND